MGRDGPVCGGRSWQGKLFTSWQIRKQNAWAGNRHLARSREFRLEVRLEAGPEVGLGYIPPSSVNSPLPVILPTPEVL